jgi:hypothetical protein
MQSNENSPTCEICQNPKDCLTGSVPCELANIFLAGENSGLTPSEVELFKEQDIRFFLNSPYRS